MLALIVPATTAASGVPVARPTTNNTFPAVLITSKIVFPAFLNLLFMILGVDTREEVVVF